MRLCDGYYWPISFSTTSDKFSRDEQACERSCTAPTRLYTYSNPGGEPEVMTDLKGAPYSKLTTAFRYRTEYVDDCKCGPRPWEQEALDRHQLYALEARLRKGDKRAVADIAALKAAMAARERSARLSGSSKSAGSGGGLVRQEGTEKTAPTLPAAATMAPLQAATPAPATSSAPVVSPVPGLAPSPAAVP